MGGCSIVALFVGQTNQEMNAETRGQVVAHPVNGTGGGERRRRAYASEPMERVRRFVCDGIPHGMEPGCGAWSAAPFVCP